jgi:hypothetical protein
MSVNERRHMLFPWTTLLGKQFTYAPSPDVWATLTEQDGKWLMAVKLKGQKYVGERKTLEEAFRATSNLIFKHARVYWLKMDAHLVIGYFDDFLKGEE